MKNLIITTISILIILSSCSLNKKQIRICNGYFNHLDNYYKYSQEIIIHTANVKYNHQKLIASAQDSTIILLDILDSAIIGYQDDILMSYELNMALMKINSYSTGYSFKSSYNTDFLRNFKQFMIEYIPFGIGSIIYEIVFATRKIIIKPNVGKKIKRHIEFGNEIIINNFNQIVLFSEKGIIELKKENEEIKNSYIEFSDKLKEKPDSWDNLSKYNPVFIEQFQELYITRQMAEHLINASNNLKYAQKEIFDITRKRHKIKTKLAALDSFYVEIRYLKNLENLLDKK